MAETNSKGETEAENEEEGSYSFLERNPHQLTHQAAAYISHVQECNRSKVRYPSYTQESKFHTYYRLGKNPHNGKNQRALYLVSKPNQLYRVSTHTWVG